jgi:molybdopterin synthase catalytic subunit
MLLWGTSRKTLMRFLKTRKYKIVMQKHSNYIEPKESIEQVKKKFDLWKKNLLTKRNHRIVSNRKPRTKKTF